MWHSNRSPDNEVYENLIDSVFANEDTFATFGFEDFDHILPCHSENLINLEVSLPKTQIMDRSENFTNLNSPTEVADEREFISASPPVAQLSPSIELEIFEFGKDLGFNYFDIFDQNLEVDKNPQSDQLFPSGSDQNSFAATDVSKSIEVSASQSPWLSKVTTIELGHLQSSSLDSKGVAQEKQVLKERAIPSFVQDTSLLDVEEEELNASTSTVTNDSADEQTSPSRGRKRRRQSVQPGSDEYKKKRELNNISVKKSREKSRKKQQETEERVNILSTENGRLQARVDSLEKELTILKGLFSNVGASIPNEVATYLSTE